jgi:FAD synthase
VEFVEKLRDEAHFENIDDLIAQMGEDERQARNCLNFERQNSKDKHGL